LIWAPSLLRRRSGRRFAAVIVVWTLVPYAVLPSVLPYDHIVTGASPFDEQAHDEHCHGAPASCSDAPLTAGVGQFLMSEPLIVAPALFTLAMLAIVPALSGITLRPALRPPLAPLAA
jgi:hypothetical protein